MAIVIRKKAAPAAAPDPLVREAGIASKPAALAAMAPDAYPLGSTGAASMPVLDGEFEVVRKQHPNAIVAWWLMASYLYYLHDLSLLSDGLYDQMAKDMLADWPKITHPHKHLISEDDLRAGSLHTLSADQYPQMTRSAARQCVRIAWGLVVPVV